MLVSNVCSISKHLVRLRPAWLDLDYAIYTCLANERLYQDRAAGRAPAQEPAGCCPHFGVPVELFVSPHRDGAPMYLPVAV